MTYVYSGEPVTIDLSPLADGRWRAVIADRVYSFAPQILPDGGIILSLDAGRHRVYTAFDGSERYAYVDGTVYTLSAVIADSGESSSTAESRIAAPTRGSSAHAESSAAELTAQMPGQVREVLIAEGESVTRGQTVLVLEAMKMEIRVSAPRDGVVKRLMVAPGEVVGRHQVLAQIE